MIVEGKYYINVGSQDHVKVFRDVKNRIIEYLLNSGYIPYTNEIPMISSNFLSMTYGLRMECHSQQDQQVFRLFSRKKKITYFDSLEKIKFDHPFMITINFRFESEKRLIIHVISKPTYYYQITQLQAKPYLDEFKLSSIIELNKEFIHQSMMAVHAFVLESPKAKSEVVKIHFRDRLDSFNLKDLRVLLEKGATKIENGNTEDGLTNLRSSLELFLVKMVEKIGEKSASQERVKDNLNILKNKGYIDERVFRLVQDILYSWLDKYLSDKPVHKREQLNLYDSKFLYTIFEDVMDFILNKVMFRL